MAGMITDPHDKRTFRRYVTLNPDGSVAAVHDIEASQENTIPGSIEVTELAPYDFSAISIAPALAGAVAVAVQDVGKKHDDVAIAQTALAQSQSDLQLAQSAARAALSVEAGKPQP